MKRLALFILAIGPFGLFAQDIHFTQINQSPLALNPALTGMFDGWERIGITHRSQWLTAGSKFHTTTIAADMNFFKPKRGNGAYMGAGLMFFNDVGGDSKFGTKQMLFNLSAVVPVAEMHTLSAGLQFGMGQRSGDLTALSFANQWDGYTFDANLPSNENNGLVSKIFVDFGVGFNYRFGNQKIGFARDDATDFRVGVSYFHVNKPNISYNFGFKEDMYSKLGINVSFLKDIAGSDVGFQGLFNQFFQGPHSETMIGALVRYRLSTGSKTTGLKRDTYLSGGLLFRVNDAIAPAIYFQWKGLNFGCSYDVTISKLGQVTRFGAIEFSLSYTNFDFALFKRRRP